MSGEIPKELKIIGDHVALRVGLVVLLICSLIAAAIVFSGKYRQKEEVVSLSTLSQMMKDFCVEHDIPQKKCKLKKPRVVLPKGSR